MWLDTADAYWTLSNEYIESVWWLFHELWDKELDLRGLQGRPLLRPLRHRAVEPRARPARRVPGRHRALGLRALPARRRRRRPPRVDDHAVDARRNVGAAVGPDVAYVRVRDPEGGRDLVLGADRVDAVLGDDAEVVGPVAVADLVGRALRAAVRLAARPRATAGACVADDFVTIDDGSGIVHLAPAFGEIDREVGEREGLPIVNPVNAQARFEPTVPRRYAGKFVKDADPALIDELAPRGMLVRRRAYTHSYPHCWRCDTPLIYWAKPTWFARTSRAQGRAAPRERDDQLAPGAHQARPLRRLAREQRRLGALARPLLGHADPGVALRRLRPRHVRRLGRRALAGAPARDLTELDLHRPYVDDVTIACADCGGRAQRVEPVLDAWFDSGSMPAAQFHYPFENADVFERRFPADFICEAIDQTRGWFYSLLAVNTLVFGRTPYRNVVCLAHIVDQDGQKMSKSRGNVIDPWSVLRDPRRRRAALVHVLVGLAVDAQARVPRGHRRDHATGSSSRSGTRTRSSSPTRTSTAGHRRRRRRRARRTCSTGGCGRGCTARSATVTDALEDFDALRGHPGARRASSTTSPTGTCAAAGPASGSRPTAPPTRPARVPRARSRSCSRRLPVRRRRAVPEPRAAPTESVHLTDWPAFDAPRSTTARSRDGARARARVARAQGAHRRQARCAPAARRARSLLVPRDATRAATTSRPRSPTS